MRLQTLVLGLLLLASPGFAADVDGTWRGSFETPTGTASVTFTLEADGDMLTGSLAGNGQICVPACTLKDGKIDGAKISFAVDLETGGKVARILYTETSPATRFA